MSKPIQTSRNTLKRSRSHLIIVLLAMIPNLVSGQDSDNQAVVLREKVAQLQALRTQRIELTQQAADQQANSRQVTELLTQQVEQAQAKVSQLSENNERQTQQLAKVQTQVRDDMQWLIDISQLASQATQQIQLPVTLSPEAQQRLTELNQALAQQAQLSADQTQQHFDALPNWLTWLQTQRQQARRIELANHPITLDDGRMFHAYVLRVGDVGTYFTLEDNSMCGYRTDKGWQTNLDPQQQQAIRQAIGMLRGQIPPALLALPITRNTKAGE